MNPLNSGPVSLSTSASRLANRGYPAQPVDAEHVVLQGTVYATTGEPDVAARQNFLLHQSSFDVVINGANVRSTIIMWSTEAMFERLMAVQTWYMDGTFKAAPEHFAQLFTIHFLFSERLFPAVWILLTHKKEEVYSRAFTIIQDLAQERHIHMATIESMSDYETGLIPAITNVLHFRPYGCMFHLQQSIYKWIQSHTLQV